MGHSIIPGETSKYFVHQGKYEIVKLLLKHGADATKKNRDGHTPLDLVKVKHLYYILMLFFTFLLFTFLMLVLQEGDQDVVDLLRGDSALLDAAKKGNLSRVHKLLSQVNLLPVEYCFLNIEKEMRLSRFGK